MQLADWLLSERGHQHAKGYTWTDWKDTAYAQDLVPVKEQKEITGHAVRAMYLYTGAADVAAQTGDTGYIKAMKRVWEDVVYRNMYVTGGIGSAGNTDTGDARSAAALGIDRLASMPWLNRPAMVPSFVT